MYIYNITLYIIYCTYIYIYYNILYICIYIYLLYDIIYNGTYLKLPNRESFGIQRVLHGNTTKKH